MVLDHYRYLIKALEFERLTAINTQVANDLLRVDKNERKKLTSTDFRHIEIGSMWMNQTIRNCSAKTKVKHFKTMWLEVNNQGYGVLRQSLNSVNCLIGWIYPPIRQPLESLVFQARECQIIFSGSTSIVKLTSGGQIRCNAATSGNPTATSGGNLSKICQR